MPYIAIKCYPKDEETKKKVAAEINEVMLKYWGCPQKAISLSFEEVAPEDWEKTVREPVIMKNIDKMMIIEGEKKF